MAQSMINIRMDTDEKNSFEDVCDQLGITITAAFKMFAKKVIRERRIPFDLTLDPFYSDTNLHYLEKITSEIDGGKAQLKEHKLAEVQLVKILWHENAWDDYCAWQTQNKKTLKKLNALIKDIQRSPFDGIGKPEPLKENLSGWWSRRIDDTNRIVYKQDGDNIIIAACKGHYN